MERIENIGFGGLKLIQDPDGFCYGVDAVILADFACSFCDDFKLAVDLGTGTGIIPFILSHKNKSARLVGIELQEPYVEMAKKSCLLNGLEERVAFLQGDVAQLERKIFTGEKVDIVTCNPPYFARGGGIPSASSSKFIARHETVASVEDFIKAASELLSGDGHFFMVHRPSRLVDIFYYCRKYRLEPKDIRYVVPRAGEIPNIVLVHCAAGGGRELKIMKELCVYESDGGYSDEIQRIYERQTR